MTSKKEYLARYEYLSDDHIIYNAFTIAYDVHRNHKRKDWSMYISHPLESNQILRNEVFQWESVPSILQASSILHDTLEDCDPGEIHKIKQQILSSCWDMVLQIVEILTKKRPEDYMTEEQRLQSMRLINGAKIVFIESIKHSLRFMRDNEYFGKVQNHNDALIVKWAEWLHNMRTIDNLTHGKINEMVQEKSIYIIPYLWNICPKLEELYFNELEVIQRKIAQNNR